MNTDEHGFNSTAKHENTIQRNFADARTGDAKAQSRDTDSTNYHQFKCAKGATDISPGLEQRDYPGWSFHKINSLARGNGRGWLSDSETG